MKEKNRTQISKTLLENISKEELHSSFDEIWDEASLEVENKKTEETLKFIKELKKDLLKEKEYIKKYGKEPEARTPDGKVNKKYIDYVLKRDFGIEPDTNYYDPYEGFSWGGLTGIEAYIAKSNCD